MTRTTTLSVFIILVLCMISHASEIDGAWKGIIEGPEGDMELIFTFKVEGQSLTGTVNGPMGETPVKNGKVNEQNFTFDTEFDGNVISHSCSVSGDTLKILLQEFQMEMLCTRQSKQDINGRWIGKMQGPEGDMELVFEFKVEGETLSGNVESPMGEMPISNTTLNGDEFSFDVDAEGMVISHQCKLQADSIVMTVGGFDSDFEMILRRQSEKK